MKEGSLVAAVVISALLFGAVEPWAIALVSVFVACAFILFAWTAERDDFALAGSKGLLISLSVCLVYPLFQLVPLPVGVIGAVQEKFRYIVTLSPETVPAFHSISVYPFATEMDFSRMLLYGMIFSAAAFGVRDRESANRILRALAIFGFALAIFGIVQHAAGNGKIYWFRNLTRGGSFFGPFVNRNHFAGFVGMIIPLSLCIALRSREMDKKLMFGFFSIVMAVSLFFSLSRGGIVSFFAGLIVFFFLSFTRGISRKKLIPVFLFVFVLVVYLLSLGVSPIIERFVRTEVSGEQRFVLWLGTVDAIKDFPLFGSGMGTFQYIFTIYKPDGITLYVEHAHNDYLEFLLEAGIVGTLLAAVFFFFLLKIIVGAGWKGRDLYLAAGFFASITTIALHSVTDFNLHIPSNALLFSLILGLAVSFSRGKEHRDVRGEEGDE